jgi:2-(1,2-epoxy-1,2-dihydrophenyl)acetyl-CoA isomerase
MTETAAESVLGYRVEGGVAWLRLNRPDSRNALDVPLRKALGEALKRAERSPEVRVVVLTGEGKAFCSGADVRDLSAENGGLEEAGGEYEAILQRLHSMPKPTIAALNGVAAGIGASLAFACDIRYAVPAAAFVEAFVKIGLTVDGGATWLLPRLIGRGKALEMFYTGNPLEAEEASKLGLVNRLVEPEHLERTVRELAERLASGPAAALGATGGFSFLFGPLFLMSILLYRNYFYRSSVSVAEGHFGALVVLSGIGYACAALVTPPVTRRLSKPAWITLLLAATAVLTLALGETFSQPAYLAIGFCLYLARQSVAICATTILQEEVDDTYRGRIFAFYDMMFNAAYVAGAALSVVIMPVDGHSPSLVALVAAGFAVVAAGYWLACRRDQSRSGASGAGGSRGGTAMPSASAQRSSS